MAESQDDGNGPMAEAADSKRARRRRRASDLSKLPRSSALSHLYWAKEDAAPPNHPPVAFYKPAALSGWLRNYLAYVFRRKHDFPPYTASPQNALYDLVDEKGNERVRIALAGDWGTGTDEAQGVANQMEGFKPHFTIHIGDVYYVGDSPEVKENCLGIRNPSNNYDPVFWPIGSRGSFAMNGNHEMYANGVGYFEVLIPELGLWVDGKMTGQQTSFFCLHNSHWCVIGLDTGYNSIGFPILGQIPILNRVPGVGGDAALRPELLEWLAKFVLPLTDKRGIILLSHHQYYSGFESPYRKPARQLWEAGIQRPVLWFWGHEHRLAGYGLFGADRLQAFGRCVGHGGMPLSLGTPTKQPAPRFYDDRKGAEGYGINGHVNLSFDGADLTATYVDFNGTKTLEETWSVDAAGMIALGSFAKQTADPDFHA